jgi:hypothetical protein
MYYNLSFTLLCTVTDIQLFKKISYVFNNSSLFMSMLNLILTNTHLMEMIKHMLIYFFIFMLVDREKERDNYKMEVVIKKM